MTAAAYLKSPPGAEPIVVEGAFRAPVDRVWRAWTELDRLRQWFGRDGADFTEMRADVRVGGRWRFDMPDPDSESRIEGEYLVVEPEARLVFTWSHVRDFADGRREATQVSTVSITFQATEGGTVLALRHENVSDAARQGVGGGWGDSFARLAEVLGA